MKPHVLAAVLLSWAAAGCGFQDPPPFEAPPADTYSARTYALTIGGDAVSVPGADVTLAFFTAARTGPLLGRAFAESDGGSGARVVVISHALWAERFDSSPEIIGRDVDLDGAPAVIVGVMPRGFEFPNEARLWTPKRAN